MAYWLYCKECKQWSKSATPLSEDKSCTYCNTFFTKSKLIDSIASPSADVPQTIEEETAPETELLVAHDEIKEAAIITPEVLPIDNVPPVDVVENLEPAPASKEAVKGSELSAETQNNTEEMVVEDVEKAAEEVIEEVIELPKENIKKDTMKSFIKTSFVDELNASKKASAVVEEDMLAENAMEAEENTADEVEEESEPEVEAEMEIEPEEEEAEIEETPVEIESDDDIDFDSEEETTELPESKNVVAHRLFIEERRRKKKQR